MDFERLPLPCLTKIEDVPREKWKVPAGLEGPFKPNTDLRKAKRLFAGQIKGSGGHTEIPWAITPCRALSMMRIVVGLLGVGGEGLPGSVLVSEGDPCGGCGH